MLINFTNVLSNSLSLLELEVILMQPRFKIASSFEYLTMGGHFAMLGEEAARLITPSGSVG